jgi:hypothetical protein
MAGLPLVVSRNSVGSQDLALPWIKTIGNLNDLPKVLKEILASNFNKVSISQFAQMNYNWETRMQNLLSYLMEFSLEEETFPDSKKFK